jgi:Transposase DDE domain
MNWKETLISLYLYTSENKNIKNYLTTLRMSNNHRPVFTDEEVMTIYIFGICQGHRTVKAIHRYTRDHLLDWFPDLPNYEGFNTRLNVLSGAFSLLSADLMLAGYQTLCFTSESVIDSMPIIVAGNRRSSTAKTAPEICEKGYCSSKDMYYYGLKLHLLGFVQPGTLPMPECCWFTPASSNDLNAAKDILHGIHNRKIYGDKIYFVKEHAEELHKSNATRMLTPVKKGKGQTVIDAADNLFSTAISRIRQPIESFFNWLNSKTTIQDATKTRSAKGLYTHVWGKFAAALFCFIFNS